MITSKVAISYSEGDVSNPKEGSYEFTCPLEELGRRVQIMVDAVVANDCFGVKVEIEVTSN